MTTLGSEQSAATPIRQEKAPEVSERHETGREMLSLLHDLPDRQQEVLRLKFQAGLSYREISSVMDLTVSHVGVIIHTALKTIRQKMGTASPSAKPSIQTNPSLSR